jgi:hypothetical protein
VRRLPRTATVWPASSNGSGPWASPPVVIDVVYTHGWRFPGIDYNPGNDPGLEALVQAAADVPEDLKGIVEGVAARGFYNPAGLKSEAILGRQAGYNDEGAGVYLTAADKEALESYRQGGRP